MTVQFAGSRSTGDRRRRRLVVNGDASSVDAALLEGDGADIQSQLVASAAAGPWVPVAEMRIWIYAALIGLCLGLLTFAAVCPSVIPTQWKALSEHFLGGARPVLVTGAQVLFLVFSAQLSILIGWYRSRGKLDFGGRYRVWPWAVGLFGLAACCLSTNAHEFVGNLAEKSRLLSWRGSTVIWLLPFCLLALPISLLLDRDTRSSRSSLWMLRFSGLLWLSDAWIELLRPELQSQPWFLFAVTAVPLFASATLFVGLWLHARVVAYICPDPPQLEQRSAWSLLLAGCCWIGHRLVMWGTRSRLAQEDDESKPKKRTKKVGGDDATAKRKRKAPVKRATTRTRSRPKTADDDDVEEPSDESMDDDSELANESSDESPVNDSADEIQDEWENDPEPPKKTEQTFEQKNVGRSTQFHKSHDSSVPAPHSRRRSSSWDDETESNEDAMSHAGESNQAGAVSEETDDDRQFQLDSGMTSDQMKGLSKRQKRDLKRQLREQERTRGR